VVLPVPPGSRGEGIQQLQELRRRAEAAAIANVAGRDRSAPTTANTEARRHFERADQLDSAGRLDEALAEYDRAIALDPGFSPAWSDKGHVLFKLRRFTDALACQERASALTPTLLTAWSNRSACLLELGRPAEALEAALRAIELAPQNPAPWMNRARCEALLGRTAEAIASYERLATLGLEPGSLARVRERIAALRGGASPGVAKTASEWIAEGARLGAAGDLDGSLRALDSALELDELAWTAWLNKAVTMAKAGCLPDALAYAEHAAELSPSGNTAAQDLRRRVEQVLLATPPHARTRAALPPGRFGPSAMARARGSADGAAAFSLAALQESISRGLIEGAAAVAGVGYHVLVPAGPQQRAVREILVDVVAQGRTVFVFRHASQAEMPEQALRPEELAALESLLAQERVARVVVGGSAPWGQRTRQAVADANARLSLRMGSGERLTLQVLGGG
jgi:tetratricopeptide (TPR) repeat protein